MGDVDMDGKTDFLAGIETVDQVRKMRASVLTMGPLLGPTPCPRRAARACRRWQYS